MKYLISPSCISVQIRSFSPARSAKHHFTWQAHYLEQKAIVSPSAEREVPGTSPSFFSEIWGGTGLVCSVTYHPEWIYQKFLKETRREIKKRGFSPAARGVFHFQHRMKRVQRVEWRCFTLPKPSFARSGGALSIDLRGRSNALTHPQKKTSDIFARCTTWPRRRIWSLKYMCNQPLYRYCVGCNRCKQGPRTPKAMLILRFVISRATTALLRGCGGGTARICKAMCEGVELFVLLICLLDLFVLCPETRWCCSSKLLWASERGSSFGSKSQRFSARDRSASTVDQIGTWFGLSTLGSSNFYWGHRLGLFTHTRVPFPVTANLVWVGCRRNKMRVKKRKLQNMSIPSGNDLPQCPKKCANVKKFAKLVSILGPVLVPVLAPFWRPFFLVVL